MSEVNEKVPIISLSAGTCFGESSLFFSYCSSIDVKCATCCELMILERPKLHAVLLDYPFYRNYFKKMITVSTLLSWLIYSFICQIYRYNSRMSCLFYRTGIGELASTKLFMMFWPSKLATYSLLLFMVCGIG